jgi:pimeloyl-ACP methyl ester carboxylesterase
MEGTGLKVRAGDVDINYEETGSGKPLVLIMGFTGAIDSWVPTFVEPLAARSRVIMFDNRGTGGTPEGDRPFTIGQFAEDTAGFLAALGLEKPDVLGWSMGGFIALELASKHPRLVGDMVLVSSYCGGENAVPIDPQIMARMADMKGSNRDIIARHLELLFPQKWRDDNAATVEELLSIPAVFPPVEVVQKQATAITDWPGVWDELPGLESRACLLCGTDDAVVGCENSVMMAGRLPGCWLVQMEGCGHGVIFQEPEKCAAVIEQFLL